MSCLFHSPTHSFQAAETNLLPVPPLEGLPPACAEQGQKLQPLNVLSEEDLGVFLFSFFTQKEQLSRLKILFEKILPAAKLAPQFDSASCGLLIASFLRKNVLLQESLTQEYLNKKKPGWLRAIALQTLVNLLTEEELTELLLIDSAFGQNNYLIDAWKNAAKKVEGQAAIQKILKNLAQENNTLSSSQKEELLNDLLTHYLEAERKISYPWLVEFVSNNELDSMLFLDFYDVTLNDSLPEWSTHFSELSDENSLFAFVKLLENKTPLPHQPNVDQLYRFFLMLPLKGELTKKTFFSFFTSQTQQENHNLLLERLLREKIGGEFADSVRASFYQFLVAAPPAHPQKIIAHLKQLKANYEKAFPENQEPFFLASLALLSDHAGQVNQAKKYSQELWQRYDLPTNFDGYTVYLIGNPYCRQKIKAYLSTLPDGSLQENFFDYALQVQDPDIFQLCLRKSSWSGQAKLAERHLTSLAQNQELLSLALQSNQFDVFGHPRPLNERWSFAIYSTLSGRTISALARLSPPVKNLVADLLSQDAALFQKEIPHSCLRVLTALGDQRHLEIFKKVFQNDFLNPNKTNFSKTDLKDYLTTWAYIKARHLTGGSL